MDRDEQLLQAAEEYAIAHKDQITYNNVAAFIAGTHWADAHPVNPVAVRDDADDWDNGYVIDTTSECLIASNKEVIESALKINEGDKEAAAQMLGISIKTLQRRMKEYGL